MMHLIYIKLNYYEGAKKWCNTKVAINILKGMLTFIQFLSTNLKSYSSMYSMINQIGAAVCCFDV